MVGAVLALTGALMGPPVPPSPAPPGAAQKDGAPPHQVRPLSAGWYAFSIAGQTDDGVSTKRRVLAGLGEPNPRVRGLAENHPDGFIAFKVGIGVGLAALGDFTQRLATRKLARLDDEARFAPDAATLRAIQSERRAARFVQLVGRAVPAMSGGYGFYLADGNYRAIARHAGAR